MSWAKVHRWLALVLVAFLFIWTSTGLLFHIKPGWGRAYDMLSAERPGDSEERFESAIGPLVRSISESGETLRDAQTQKQISPLSEANAKRLVDDALSRSAYRADYGEVSSTWATDQAVSFRFRSGVVVAIGRDDARISQHGRDTDHIDWLYRIHYLQWTGIKSIDRVLAIVGLLLVWAVVIPGLVLFVRALRRR